MPEIRMRYMAFKYVILLSLLEHIVARQPSSRRAIQATEPHLPYDPKTIASCTWWYDYEEEIPDVCELIIGFGFPISEEQFMSWNPSVKGDCSSRMEVGKSYCVEADGSVVPQPPFAPTSAAKPTSGSVPPLPTSINLSQTPVPATPTKQSNGIETPSAMQPGMVDNCNRFALVEQGDTCTTVARKNSVSLADFLKWNPEVGGQACGGLWLNAYTCVGVIGMAPPAVATKQSNSVQTPSPIQDGMVGNCKAFHFVQAGDVCYSVAAKYRISVDDMLRWNPAVGSTCANLWLNTWACVGVL